MSKAKEVQKQFDLFFEKLFNEKPLKENEYRCSICGGIFEKGVTEEEAIKEKDDLWGKDIPIEECCLVCDDCFKKLEV